MVTTKIQHQCCRFYDREYYDEEMDITDHGADIPIGENQAYEM